MVRWLERFAGCAALSVACVPAAPPIESELPRTSPTPKRPRRPPDEPASCLDSATRAENVWTRETEHRLLERMSGFSRCMPNGFVTRREFIAVMLSVLPDRTLVGRGSVKTTLSNCKVADCILDAFAEGASPSAHLVEEAKPVTIWAVLSPHSAPRPAPQGKMPTWLGDATRCSEPKNQTGGRIPAEAIQRIVRSSYGAFRRCYERGLAREPTLEGRVSIRFIIERDGRTTDPVIYDNTVPDCRVSSCVRDEFAKLTYPAPEGGTVTVVYPIWFEF